MHKRISRNQAIAGIHRQLQIFLNSHAATQGVLTPHDIEKVSFTYKHNIDLLRSGHNVPLVKYFGQGAILE